VIGEATVARRARADTTGRDDGGASIGQALHGLVADLYPICRSITGDGVRQTLRRIASHIPLTIEEVPTGTPVLDWTVPNEWTIRDAWVADASGARVIDFRRSNLHVMSYSVPVRATMTLAELRPHLFTLPEQPDRIPYRTSYYREAWGFCLTHRQLQALPEGTYDVCIDATLAPGTLSYGECYLPGATADEVLLSTHVCHPSLGNDNLSGVAVATRLAAHLAALPRRRYSYRLLFAPGTIGAITWLARNEHRLRHVAHGLVLACLGDRGRITYKKSRRGTAEIDAVVAHVLATSADAHDVVDFRPHGYDERQFCSPGFDLPVGCLTRTPPGQFPEYHTSADDLDFVRPESLADSYEKLRTIVSTLERNAVYVNRAPKGEPQLGRRGLYRSIGGDDAAPDELALLWVLNLSDGHHSLLAIAERAGYPFETIWRAATRLQEHGLLEPAQPP
jgi:aminopeptidase-like protein